MPVLPKVKSRIAALSALASVLASVLAAPFGASSQDAVPGRGVSTPLEPTLADRLLAPLPRPIVILEDFTGATAENVSIEINLLEQRLTVRVGEKLAVNTPITTGRKATPTPEGEFVIKGRAETVEDDDYGNFTDKDDRILIAGVFRQLDAPPRGSRFAPVARKYALDVEGGKFRILAGHVRTTPSTEGTIVIPEAVAWALYEKIPDGAKVHVLKDTPAADAAADPAPSAPPAP